MANRPLGLRWAIRIVKARGEENSRYISAALGRRGGGGMRRRSKKTKFKVFSAIR
jgi:hypothetical protein